MIKNKKKLIFIAIIAVILIIVGIIFIPKGLRIIRMINFVNDKYDMELSPFPVIYGNEDKSTHSDILGNGFTRDIPYYAIFDLGYNDDIIVTERDGILSDDHQLENINRLLGDHLSKITGYAVGYVEVRDPANGNIYDEKISRFIQTKFTQLITEDNIADFLTGICEESDTELVIYVQNTDNRESMLEAITTKLTYLADINTVKSIIVYFYTDDYLTTGCCDTRSVCTDKNGNIDFTERNYLFNTSFVVNPYEHFEVQSTDEEMPNEFVLRAEMILDRGYTAGHGLCKNEYEYNGWIIGEF